MRNDSLIEAELLATSIITLTRRHEMFHLDSLYLAYLYPHLGHIYDRQGRVKKALKAYREGGPFMLLRDEPTQVNLLRWAATLYSDRGYYNKARQLVIRAKILAARLGNKKLEALVDTCLTTIPDKGENVLGSFIFSLSLFFIPLLTIFFLALVLYFRVGRKTTPTASISLREIRELSLSLEEWLQSRSRV